MIKSRANSKCVEFRCQKVGFERNLLTIRKKNERHLHLARHFVSPTLLAVVT